MTRGRSAATACTLAFVLSLATTPARAQGIAPVTVDLLLASSTIDRTAAALSTTAAVASRTADIALKSVFKGRVQQGASVAAAARLAKLAFLDVPLAHFAAGLNHEVGHMTWARQEGARLDFRLKGGPWSSNAFDLRCDQPHAPLGLGTYGGGFDAGLLLERRMWDRIAQEGRSSVSDAVFLLDGAIGRFYYVQQSLSSITGWARDDLGYRTGDPTRYVYHLVGRGNLFVAQDVVLSAAKSMKRRSWLNFADFALWGQAVNLVRYVASGREAFEPRWLRVKSVRLSPFARYHLSPAGPEMQVGTHYLAGQSVGDVTWRWTGASSSARLVGAGFSWAATTRRVVNPHVRADVWREVTRKQGVSIAGGLTAARWPRPNASLRFSVGAKTGGYALGLPMQAAAFGEAGLRVRF